MKKNRLINKRGICFATIVFSTFGLVALIILSPFFPKSIKDLIPIIYIEKPKNFNWISEPLPEHKALYSASMNGLVVNRDSSFDNLNELNRKILTFSPSDFLELNVGSKKYNVRNEKDARYMSKIISKFQDYTSSNYSFLGLKALKINQKTFSNFAFSDASNIQMYERGTYFDYDNGVANPNGKAYIISLKENLKWDDGSPLVIEDFLIRIKQQIDNNSFFYRTKEKIVEASLNFENTLSNKLNWLKQFLFKKSLKKRVSDLKSLNEELINEINNYSSLTPIQQSESLYQSIFFKLDNYYSEYDALFEFYNSFSEIYSNLSTFFNKNLINKLSVNSVLNNNYRNILKTMVDTFQNYVSSLTDNKFKWINTNLVTIKNSINQILLIRSNVSNYVFQFKQNLINIEKLNSFFENLQTEILDIFDFLSFKNLSLKKIKTDIVNINIENKAVEIPHNYDFYQSENFVREFHLPTSFTQVFIENEGKLRIKNQWNVMSGNDIMSFCTTKNLDIRKRLDIDPNNLNFDTVYGDIFFENTNEMCDNYTLIYEKDNKIVFRFPYELEDELFLEFLSSPHMFPLKNDLFNQKILKNKFKKQAFYANNNLDYIANGAFSISAINYDGITFKKNRFFWNAKNVNIEKFILKYDNYKEKASLNDISSLNINDEVLNKTRDYFMKNYKNNNFSYQRFQKGSSNLIFDLYNPYFTNRYFERKIGSKINWWIFPNTFTVNNYVINKTNECEIQNQGLLLPKKTYDNYLCGIIPEYREFISALRLFLFSTFDRDLFRRYLNYPLWNVKETFIPPGMFEGKNNIDYVNYVKNLVDQQNTSPMIIDNLDYESSLVGYSSIGKEVKKIVKRSSLPFALEILNIKGYSEYFDLEKGFYPKIQILKNKSALDDTTIFEHKDIDLTYPKALWQSILENTPPKWLENIEVNLNFKSDKEDIFTSALNTAWKTNISKIVKNKINFDESIAPTYIYKTINPPINNLENYFLVLNEELLKTSFNLNNVPRHLLNYFFSNIKDKVNLNQAFLSDERAKLFQELNSFKASFFSIFENDKGGNLVNLITSKTFSNYSHMFKIYFFAEIEAYLLRETFIIPISGQKEVLFKLNVNAPLINDEYFDMSYAYFCNNNEKIWINNYIREDLNYIFINPPKCEEVILLRELNKVFKNV